MPYFESPCSLPQNRVLLPCRTAEICRPIAWVRVLKPLICRILSSLWRIGVRFGINSFPGFSRMAGKFASTAPATIAAPFVRRLARVMLRGRETPGRREQGEPGRLPEALVEGARLATK